MVQAIAVCSRLIACCFLCVAMALNGAAAALLGAEGVDSGYSQRESETGDKRSKLRRYEHVGPQVLNVAVKRSTYQALRWCASSLATQRMQHI